ncbi:hypothetical protein H0A36_25365 [Endozoicomonas sp. SM1973]|uniref:Uncharacterized protein n=1 Tax=Spartinivicinus marinus TaxID=2994442 RepID=A0A853IBX5_9GAMM|nr:hypothetical protein [Spartinivicinus marinus]NYZ69352.1 hypothetical protein [Spartinivicinus marinus]
MNKSSQGRFSLIQKYINRWLSLPNSTRAILTDKVVTAFFNLNLDQILTYEAIKFKTTNGEDCINSMRVNSQKLFRWLGYYEEQPPSIEKLLHLEPAIVAAMPNDLKIAYLNEVYAGSGVYIGVKQGNEPTSGGGGSINQVAASMTKENAEAQIAVFQLGTNPTIEQIKNTYRELAESVGTTLGAIEYLENKFSGVFGKDRRQWAKAV